MKTYALFERLDLDTLTEAQIDREQRTVKQRLIRVGESANKRVYSEAVLKTALPLFEGVKAYANHPSKTDMSERPERSIRDLTGWFTSPVFESDGVYATRHFANTQAGQDAWNIVEQIVTGQAPASLMGGSINAIGKASKRDDGTTIVETIAAVHSVDDVTTPAAGGAYVGLLASHDDMTAVLLQNLTFEEWFECRPEYTKRLQNELKQVRQDAAVKAAQAEAHQHAQAVLALQESLNEARAEFAAALDEVETARRALAVEKLLRKAGLPATWENDLRTRLLESTPDTWEGLMQTELSKAKRVDARPTVPVSGAGQRIAEPVQLQEDARAVLPRDYENTETWAQRILQRNIHKGK